MSETRPVASRQGRPWNEDSIRSELSEFLEGWEVWPTYEQFVQGGAKGLRDALYRFRGVQYWVKEMGLPGGNRQPGGVRRWTDEAIHGTLAEFFGNRKDWPSQGEFDAAGLHALREALRHYGGPERWAKQMGVVLPRGMARSTARPRPPADKAPKPPQRPLWSKQRIQIELEQFLQRRTEWPRHREFVEAGHKQLYQAVLRNGGTAQWARRMGVKKVKRHGGHPSSWTEERVREDLSVFLAGRELWPTTLEFKKEGHGPLLRGIARTGGASRWAREFGLRRTRHGNRRRSGPHRNRRAAAILSTSWDEEQIEQSIRPLVEKLGRWPTKSEFRDAGLRPALSAVYDHGGRPYWQTRLAVGPSPFDGPVPDRTRWTEQLIAAELRKLCKGRKTWPTHSEFRAAGAGALYSAVHRHGGQDMWRTRLGL